MAQLAPHRKIDPLQGANSGQCDTKKVDVQIKHPAKVYDVFKNEPYRLPYLLSPNHVASETLVKGEWGKKDSEKAVVYYPRGKKISRQTEWFKDKLISANESEKSVAWKALEGDVLKDYKSFSVELVVDDETKMAQWTIKYEKKNTSSPDPDNYLALLEIVTKDVDGHPSATK